MAILRFILGDQLSRGISSLRDISPARDVVLMAESRDETTYVRHHQQKIVLVLSAMRHFAESIQAEGIPVDYVRLDDEGNSGSFTEELRRALSRHRIDKVIVTEPGEWRVWEMIQTWGQTFGIPVEIREDDRFLCSRSDFESWAKGRKTLRMEFFYRHMRQKTGWLMDGAVPRGGRWNYDIENRKPLPQELTVPHRARFRPDAITREVMALVSKHFGDHPGNLNSFGWAVTREDAISALVDFMESRLPRFGAYQDAMRYGEDTLFHSTLSPYMNIGLLNPREVCEAALRAHEEGSAPLSSVEGFVRQILGWREFVRGIYWLRMPDYAETNFLHAGRALPDFYWTGQTRMSCLQETIRSTLHNAYAHHIQRLMITGNFALLTSIRPSAVEEWYLAVYADAFEWVELPNTHGMALHADGGLLGSKPYAASGAYIDRMSDHCTRCVYNPAIKLGPQACPFNYLYWNFLIVHEEQLRSNPRMALPYRTLARMNAEQQQEILRQAEEFLVRLEEV